MSKYTTMNIKNIPKLFKKCFDPLIRYPLTIGSSLILGFLSFSGTYALLPLLPAVLAPYILPFAFAAFFLSILYEGEIYSQNISSAKDKLTKRNHLKNTLAKEFLLNHFPDINDEHCPQFFKDYLNEIKLYNLFGHKELNKASKQRKKRVEKTLRDMEKLFALHLFTPKHKQRSNESPYIQELQLWLEENGQKERQELLKDRKFTYKIILGFSGLAGLFMGFGSTYLIVEAFSVIPFFAAIPFTFWPVIIVPMAVVAGAAYAMLTYNAVTDLANNNTILEWYERLREDLSKGVTVRNLFMTFMAVVLFFLAAGLTICTAGTWWTIANEARPLFEWMKKIPPFVMGVINPIITGLSAVFFIFQNTAESLDLVDKALKSDYGLQNIFQSVIHAVKQVYATENWLQLINPFRLIIKLTITPLRVLLFLGHLISIALTTDRVPGVPLIVAALIAIISEGFEDAHYFIGHEQEEEEHAHGHHPHADIATLLENRLKPDSEHTHEMDLPTWILKTVAIPLYFLAAVWDSAASQFNSDKKPLEGEDHHVQPRALSLLKAWHKQRGIKEKEDVKLPANVLSKEWQVEHALSLINKHQKKHLQNVHFGQKIADAKWKELNHLKDKVRASLSEPEESLTQILNQAREAPVYNQHRLFALDDKTGTQHFIEALPERVNAVGAA